MRFRLFWSPETLFGNGGRWSRCSGSSGRRLWRTPHNAPRNARRCPTACCCRRTASSSSGSPQAIEPACSVPRVFGIETGRGCRIRKAGFRKVRKPPGCLNTTTTTGMTCSRRGSCWRWRHCWMASWRRRTANSGRCCCARFRVPWKPTICSLVHVYPGSLPADRRQQGCSRATTINSNRQLRRTMYSAWKGLPEDRLFQNFGLCWMDCLTEKNVGNSGMLKMESGRRSKWISFPTNTLLLHAEIL